MAALPPPPPAPGPPPAWYPDPSGRPGVRWWDGTRWTEHVSVPPAHSLVPGPQVGTGVGTVTLAAWWPRLGAYIIDALIIGIPTFVAGLIAGSVQFTTSTEVVGHRPLSTGAQVAIFVTSFVLAIGYPYLLLRYRGRTLGMMASRIRAVDRVGGGTLTTKQTWRRVLTSFLFLSLLGEVAAVILYNRTTTALPPAVLIVEFVGFALTLLTGLWPLGNPLNQTLQDRTADTIVIRERPLGF